MTLYVDSSALLKQYLNEPESEEAIRILDSDSRWATVRLTQIEVRRILGRELVGPGLKDARELFSTDWELMEVVEVDAHICDRATEFAEVLGVRTLDAVHLAAAALAGAPRLAFVTYDLRQARAARSMGWPVLGA